MMTAFRTSILRFSARERRAVLPLAKAKGATHWAAPFALPAISRGCFTALCIPPALDEARGHRPERADHAGSAESRCYGGPGRNATADWRQAADAAGRPAGASCRSAGAASTATACGRAGACRAAGRPTGTPNRAGINSATSDRRKISRYRRYSDHRRLLQRSSLYI